MAIIFLLLAMVLGLASFVCGIIILINAFQQDVTKGFLCLCIPFYVLYFAFALFDHEKKGLVLGLWLGGSIGASVLQVMAGAFAG
ncbi:MAG: hypothetical protein CMJ70_11120 [Planctomycetaceae bacterium]|nr:hypothetical protein [Planctomycetaceae bacterium]